MQRMEFREDDVRVGIVVFGSDILVDKNIPLDEYAGNKEGLVAAIKSILWKSHGTEIRTAIDYVTQRLRPDGGFGARPDSTKVAIFVTDGNSHDGVTTAIAAARREGVILHAVGAGETLNLTVLNQIADQPEYVYFNPWDHRNLDVIYTNASQALICDVPYPGERMCGRVLLGVAEWRGVKLVVHYIYSVSGPLSLYDQSSTISYGQ